MRTGLVAVGAAIAIVGAGVVAVAMALPHGTSQNLRTGSVVIDSLLPGSPQMLKVNGTQSDRATVSFSWTSSGLVSVTWYVAYNCSTPRTWCVEGSSPLAAWPNNTSGRWSVSGTAAGIYCVSVNDQIDRNLTFDGELREEVDKSAGPLPMLPLAWTAAGGALLLGIGGIATYLGLFLPPSVYDPPGPSGSWEEAAPSDGGEADDPPYRSGPPP